MARESKTKYALLGLLSFRPMSGYDIKKAVEKSLGYFWSESYGQIYPIIKTLADEGLAEKTVERQEGKPDRHVYAITDAGRQVLCDWLERPAEPMKERIEVLLKIFFGQQLAKEGILRHLERFREEHSELLATYRVIEALLIERSGEFPGGPYPLLTVRCGIHVSQGYINWCNEAIDAVQQFETMTVAEEVCL